MASSFSEPVRQGFLTQYFKQGPVFAAFFKSDPRPNGLGEEVSSTGTGYARFQVPFGAISVDSASGEVIVASDVELQSPTATASWGLIGWVGLMSAIAGGSFICGAPLQVKKQVEANDYIVIPAGGILAKAT